MDINSKSNPLESDISNSLYSHREWKERLWNAFVKFWDFDERTWGSAERVINNFIDFWHEELDSISYIKYFISPELRWKYVNDLIEIIENKSKKNIKNITKDIDNRIRFEFLMECDLLNYIEIPYETDGYLVVGNSDESIDYAVNSLISQIGYQYQKSLIPEDLYYGFAGMIIGFLMMIKSDGYYPKLKEIEKYREWVIKSWPDKEKDTIDPDIIIEYILIAVSRLIKPLPFCGDSDKSAYIIDPDSVHISVDKNLFKCEKCGKTYYAPYEIAGQIVCMTCLSDGCKGKLLSIELCKDELSNKFKQIWKEE